MINILTFWIGDEDKFKDITAKFNNLLIDHNVNIIYGPSTDDHHFLYTRNKYYKSCYDNKKYAFCSDVWRVYKACHLNNVLYIDALTIINYEQFGKFLKLTKKYDLIFQCESKFFFTNALFFSKKCGNKIFIKCYKKYEKIKNIKAIKSGPYLMSKFVYKYHGYGVKSFVENELLALHPREFSNYNDFGFFKYNGQASWSNKSKHETVEYFRTMEIEFDKKECKCVLVLKRILVMFFSGRWTNHIIYNKFIKKIYYHLLNSKKK